MRLGDPTGLAEDIPVNFAPKGANPGARFFFDRGKKAGVVNFGNAQSFDAAAAGHQVFRYNPDKGFDRQTASMLSDLHSTLRGGESSGLLDDVTAGAGFLNMEPGILGNHSILERRGPRRKSIPMNTSKLQGRDRIFKVWEYQVSHGQLLIRSPKAPATKTTPERVTNVDLVCLGVEYVALPRILRGLELSEPTTDEVQQLEVLLGTALVSDNIKMLISEGKRFPVVAASFTLSENDWDIFESPFEFRSQFRETQ